jgi:hypothetical protein
VPVTTARDRVLAWLDGNYASLQPITDIRDLILAYDALLVASLRLAKRGNPRKRHELSRCLCDICHDWRDQQREDAREPVEPYDEE